MNHFKAEDVSEVRIGDNPNTIWKVANEGAVTSIKASTSTYNNHVLCAKMNGGIKVCTEAVPESNWSSTVYRALDARKQQLAGKAVDPDPFIWRALQDKFGAASWQKK